MGINIWFPDYDHPAFKMHLATGNANRLLDIGGIKHDYDAPAGELSPEELSSWVYELEDYIIKRHNDEPRLWLFARYLVVLSRMSGCALSNGLSVRYG